jgi:predicted nicotinamide N-methyase
MSAGDPDAFIRAETRIGAAALVPELRLHLADRALPLWEATEATLAANNLPPPYWAFAWPGGQAMARLLLDRPDLVRGKRVVDFGAGCGIAAMAAAKSGAACVTAIDIDPFARAAMAMNAALNGVDIGIVEQLPERVCDLLLLGDMCYERPLAERVMGFARTALGNGTMVLLADPGRAYRPQDGLEEVARYQVATSLDLEDREIRETVVWRLVAGVA